ncbi:MAG: Asp23/Gls24 family envelope stress response protein [Eubacterium sp.]|nr:Asp23/Gls24 family envelope stress response protein [Eubacterium sp.]
MGEKNITVSNIQITSDVVSSIASTAALDVAGVAGLETGSNGNFLMSLLGKNKTVDGVAVKMEGTEVELKMNVVAYFGYNLSELGCEVQKSVKTAVEKMAGMKVKKADINIVGIEKKPAEAENAQAEV